MKNNVEDLLTLKSIGIPGKPMKAPSIVAVIWYPSSPSWVKLNTGGLAKGNPGPAASGGVFRNHRGFVKGVFCCNLGVHSSFFAELHAALTGICIAWDKGWNQLWLECDSSSVVQCLHNPTFRPPWPLKIKWQNCMHYLKHMQFHCTHIFKEGNYVADLCANLGLSVENFRWWWTAPSEFQPAICHDIFSLPRYRFRPF
ncbi:hypothetical protein L1049_028388 [Liquidambar formosana]|uniref:RNase H type-1 domain-containing protein n=1 Tax=Liquidambar formosana TaxID=63359 RepID=A0AAP0RKL9_LIQFO